MQVGNVVVDLTEPFGPQDARKLIEDIGPLVALAVMSYSHDIVHSSANVRRRRARWRPWRWGGIDREEAEDCAEARRRYALIHDVAVAMSEEHDAA